MVQNGKRGFVGFSGIYWARREYELLIIAAVYITKYYFGKSANKSQRALVVSFWFCLCNHAANSSSEWKMFSKFAGLSPIDTSSLLPPVYLRLPVCIVYCVFTCSCHAACWSHWSGPLIASPTCWLKENFPAAGSQALMFDSEPATAKKYGIQKNQYYTLLVPVIINQQQCNKM